MKNKKNQSGNLQEIKKQRVFLSKGEYYSGPLPVPEQLENYDKIYPGAAKIIFDTFQQQTNHRINLEEKIAIHMLM